MAGVDHWDRDRYRYERDRPPLGGERRERFESHDHHFRGPGPSRRDHSDERYDRPRSYDEDLYVRDRRQYNDEPLFEGRGGYDRDVVIEKDRSREVVREVSPPPVRRPGVLRRQSSLDIFDRRPLHVYEHDERYGPPARREDVVYRPEPIPLPRAKALPPPRRVDERFYEDVRIADPDMYGDDEFRPYPERVWEKEREVVRTRKERRGRSPGSMTSRSYARTSRSSSVSSKSSSRSRATTAQSVYPKKGKTRMPSKLVSKRALIGLGYPFIEEGNSIIILKALGQDNINEVLKVSEEYKKSELETLAAQSAAGNIAEERREVVFALPAPAPASTVVDAAPPPPPPVAAAPVTEMEVVKKETVVRDISPSRYSTTTGTTAPVIIDAREYGDIGPLALRTRSASRSGRRGIRAEIRALEAELAARKRGTSRGDIVRAERLSDGQLVVYEERVEKIDEGYRGPRIEKDRKGPPPGVLSFMLNTLS